MSMQKIFKFPFLIVVSIVLLSCDDNKSNDNDNGGNDSGSDGFSPSVVYLWVSTTTTAGDIGGLDAAHTICETDASNSNLPGDVSQHFAVLATSSHHPKSMFDSNPAVKKPDQTSIASSWSDFFDAQVVIDAAVGQGDNIWTGIGTSPIGEVRSTCNDWTTSASGVYGDTGIASYTNLSRFAEGENGCDDSIAKLYCVSF